MYPIFELIDVKFNKFNQMGKKNFCLKSIFSGFVEKKILRSDSEDSIRTYKSIRTLFFKWLSSHNRNIPIHKFSRSHALEFLDWYEESGVIATSRNNRLGQIRPIFSDMLEAGIIQSNPFTGIRKLKEPPVKKRCLTQGETMIIAEYLSENHYWLFLGFLLEYYCFIRPKEMRYLKFSDFDLVNGCIHIRVDVAKNDKSAWVTIPDSALVYFRDKRFSSNPVNYFVFGRHFKPHPSIKLSPNAMRKSFGNFLQKLQDGGLLGDMTGITWYRVKDTGITDMANDPTVSIFETSKQARHSSTEMTMKYYHPPKVNPLVKKYDRKLF